MFNQVLKKVVNFVNHDYLVTIISDFEGANAETKHLMTQIGTPQRCVGTADLQSARKPICRKPGNSS